MLEGKRIAVVMPAYNAARTLERTLADISRHVVDDIILVAIEATTTPSPWQCGLASGPSFTTAITPRLDSDEYGCRQRPSIET
jgi:hypothetical protein